MLKWLLMVIAVALPCAAKAEWRVAETPHFIVYREGSDAELRQAATDLERYDYLVRLMLELPKIDAPKLKIYLMKDMEAVQRTLGYGQGSGIAGYYSTSSRGTIAVGLRKDTGQQDWDLSSQTVLFHEYAHHLMLQHYGFVYPTWYTEGFAEYYAATKVLPNNVYEIGHIARHRTTSMDMGSWIPLKKLLAAKSYKDVDDKVWMVYAQGWLLVHYLADNPSRSGQLRKYLAAINNGVSYEAAVDAAFGPGAEALNKELRSYARQRKMEGLRISFPSIDIGGVETRSVSPSQSALIGYEIALHKGVFARHAEKFVKDLRAAAAPFSKDAYALALVAEAQRALGNLEAARVAVDASLKLEPGSARTMALKGRIETQALAATSSADERAWGQARKWLTDAAKATPNDPYVLDAWYDGYAAAGKLPPARAQNALFRAMELVPQDTSLRQKVAADFEARGLIDAAILAIRPAALRAHAPEEEDAKAKAKREKEEEKWRLAGTTRMETPREMLARLEGKLAAASGAPAAATAPAAQEASGASR